MTRTRPPFRADHVGSLLRPPELHAARARHAAGELAAAGLRAAEDAAVAEAVAMQQRVGLQTATDGEFRRSSWHMDFIYRLGGVSKVLDASLSVRFQNAEEAIEFTPPALRVESPIRLDETIFGDDFTYLRERAGASTAKLTIPSPNMVHYRGGRASIDRPSIRTWTASGPT